MSTTRPRIEGRREAEILDATLRVLLDVGYDRLTLDRVAREAHAGKASLYRRWDGKPSLVLDALMRHKGFPEATPDTGTLRGDLIELACGSGGAATDEASRFLGAMLTAVSSDEEFAREFRERFLAPKVALSRTLYERAIARGEISADADLEVIVPALAGILLHRRFVLGEATDDAMATRVIDHVILPALAAGSAAPEPTRGRDAAAYSPRTPVASAPR